MTTCATWQAKEGTEGPSGKKQLGNLWFSERCEGSLAPPNVLILQVAPRVAKFSSSLQPFPAPVEVHAELGPKELFGEQDLTGKLPHRPAGVEVSMRANMKTGGVVLGGSGRLPKPKLEIPFFDTVLTVDGALAIVKFECSDAASLQRAIVIVEHTLPAILSTALAGPVYVLDVYGSVANRSFQLEPVGSTNFLIRAVSPDDQIKSKVALVGQVPAEAAERIFAAQRYLMQARRLRYAASFEGEFVGERLLNLCKSIEVLFGRQTSDLRPTLAALGLRDQLIEFIVALVYVRDQSDVGHPALQLLTQKEYETIHTYALSIEEVVDWLIDHVTSKTAAEEYALRTSNRGTSSRVSTIARIAELSKQINPLRPGTFLRSESEEAAAVSTKPRKRK